VFIKNNKVRATVGLRKQWQLEVKSKVEVSASPSPLLLVGSLQAALSYWWAYRQAEILTFIWWGDGEMRLPLGSQHLWELSINGQL